MRNVPLLKTQLLQQNIVLRLASDAPLTLRLAPRLHTRLTLIGTRRWRAGVVADPLRWGVKILSDSEPSRHFRGIDDTAIVESLIDGEGGE